MSSAVDAAAPSPADPPRETLAKVASDAAKVGRGKIAEKAGDLLWWLVKSAGEAIVAIGVSAGLGGDDDSGETRQGKLEYDVHSGNMLIRWRDGSTTLAPKEYQPHPG